MEWPARSPDLNPIEHLWDYLGREVAALNPPPRSLHELKQGLLCVWSSLPIPVSDNLINSMGNRCCQCIQFKLIFDRVRYVSAISVSEYAMGVCPLSVRIGDLFFLKLLAKPHKESSSVSR
ncbi:DDE_3 domain-containing protein [Trichonephila clavipes]|nr:DDE_3 domain-containing protein [Trichonephila clavipes]